MLKMIKLNNINSVSMNNKIKNYNGFFNNFLELPSEFKIQVLLENICEEFEFVVGLFYKIMDDNKNYISC